MTQLEQWANRRKGLEQFPREVVGDVTIYPTFTDLVTGNQINVRVVLHNAFWNDDSIAVFQRTGQQTVNNVTLYIPWAKEVTGREYVTPDKWNNLAVADLDKYWTANPKQLPLMVKGDNPHEFSWAAPTSANRITIQENAFLNQNPDVRRARDINEQPIGTPDMWHVVIRA